MSKYDVYSSATEPIILRVLPDLAAEIGLNASLVLLQMAYWIRIGRHEHDGRYWTYQSLRDMQEKAFPFWSHMTIQRAIERLLEKNLLIARDDLNQRKGDNTRWFALNPEGFTALRSVTLVSLGRRLTLEQSVTGLEQLVTAPSQDVTTLPQTTAENTQRDEAPLPGSHYEPPAIRVLNTDTALQMNGYGLVAAYAEETGIAAETIFYAGRKVAAGLAKGGVTPEDVRGFMAELRTNPDRFNGYRFNYLAEDLPRWKQRPAQPAALAVSETPEQRRAREAQEELERAEWRRAQGVLS